jgi:hypothetical protein
MAEDERLTLIRREVEKSSQAKVAAEMGYSAATISQILSGNYQGSPEAVLVRADEVYGNRMVACPGQGEDISLGRCVEYRRRPFSAINPQRVKMYRACRGCGNNTDPRQAGIQSNTPLRGTEKSH